MTIKQCVKGCIYSFTTFSWLIKNFATDGSMIDNSENGSKGWLMKTELKSFFSGSELSLYFHKRIQIRAFTKLRKLLFTVLHYMLFFLRVENRVKKRGIHSRYVVWRKNKYVETSLRKKLKIILAFILRWLTAIT